MQFPTRLLPRFLHDECGSDRIEDAPIAAVLAPGSLATFGTLTHTIGSECNRITNSF